MPSRSIQGRDLIHPFPWRSCCPPPGAFASLLFLISSSPFRAHFCATFAPPIAHTALTQSAANGLIAKAACGPLASLHALWVPPGPALDPLFLGPAFEL